MALRFPIICKFDVRIKASRSPQCDSSARSHRSELVTANLPTQKHSTERNFSDGMHLLFRTCVVLSSSSFALLSLGSRPTLRFTTTTLAMADEYYRHDGVKITHDPYAPGMAEKYGLPGSTDPEGFDRKL